MQAGRVARSLAFKICSPGSIQAAGGIDGSEFRRYRGPISLFSYFSPSNQYCIRRPYHLLLFLNISQVPGSIAVLDRPSADSLEHATSRYQRQKSTTMRPLNDFGSGLGTHGTLAGNFREEDFSRPHVAHLCGHKGFLEPPWVSPGSKCPRQHIASLPTQGRWGGDTAKHKHYQKLMKIT